jgi:hypothetical protein
VKNPQSNAVLEQLHQSIGNSLHTLNYAHLPRNAAETVDFIKTALQIATYATQASMISTMRITPGLMAFHWDMFLNIPLEVDFALLRHQRQALIDKNLLRANAKRIDFDYQPDLWVLKLSDDPKKMEL